MIYPDASQISNNLVVNLSKLNIFFLLCISVNNERKKLKLFLNAFAKKTKLIRINMKNDSLLTGIYEIK